MRNIGLTQKNSTPYRLRHMLISLTLIAVFDCGLNLIFYLFDSQAEELNVLVANAFRMAYAHAQSHSPASNRDSMTPPAGNQPVRTSSFTVNQPTTPIPISGSPAMTFQDMLRGSLRDSTSSPGLSRSPAHNVGGAQTGSAGGDEELSARLLQISTPNVDQMVLERRHRRNADQSSTLTMGGGLVEDSTLSHVSSTANSSSPSSRVRICLCSLCFEFIHQICSK